MNTTSTFKMKPKLRLLVTGVLLLLVGWVNAQTTHLSPTINNGGFESGSTGWTFVNAAHSWTVGTNAGAFFGTNSAYISPNSSAYSYSNTTTATSHMYRDIAIPALQTDISLSFQHKGVGEPGWDRLLVYAAPNTFTPTAGTPNSNSTVNGAATLIYTAPMNSSSYALVTVSIPGSFAGTTMRLIFTWQNDNSVGSNPPSSIDDVTLVSNIGPGIYYSKAGATNFADPASWGSNTDGTGASPASVSSADNFNISNGSVMVLNSNASVRTLTILSGSLSVAANTLTVAIPGVNNSNLTMSGGTLTVSGLGTVNVNGQFQVLGTAAFNQSGGNINVDGNAGGVAANSVPSGQSIVNFTSSVLNLTGGTFTIVDPHASTIASESFRYNTGTSYNSGAGHTFRFGNGVSTDAGGDATNGFRTNTWQSSGRFLFGNITVDLVTTASNRFVTHIWSHGINGNLTINTGDYRANVGTYVAGNVVNNGTLTTTNTLLLSTFFNGTAAPVSTPQTISGTGVFRNSTTASTANFLNLTVNNTSSSGVTFTGANSVISGTNTGTVSGTLTFTNGRITSANTFVLGVSTTTLGTLTTVSGGFTAGTTFRRWFSTTSMVTLLSATTPVFPFVTTTGQDRSVFLARNGTTFTTGGWIEATHAPTAGLVTVAITDGPYNVNRRTAASWSFASGGSINIGASVLSVGARADGAFTLLAAPGAAPRFVQAAGALGTHTAGTGSAISPIANRGGLTLANLTGAQHFVGVATADLPIFSIASGNWNTGATWSTNSVPTPSDIVLVTTGTTVTVNSAAAANILTVQGSLDVTAGTLTVTGTAAGNGVTISGGGSLNASGGTVNVGIVGNVTNNRTLLVANAGTLNVSAAGLVNVYGNLNFATGSAFVQTGGNIVVDGNAGGVAANSVPVGVSIVNFSTANVAGATGGTLTIVDPHANATSTLAFGFNMPAGFNCALGVGHTLRFGNGVSTDAGGSNTRQFGVDHWVTSSRMVFGNVQISTGAGINRVVTNPFTTQTVGGNLTIDAGSEWSASFIRLGGNVTNNGTLTVTGELAFCTSELVAFAQAPAPNAQTIGGSGVYRNAVAATANAPQMLIGNSSAGGVTFNIPFTQQGNFLAAQGRINTTTTNVLTHIKTTVGQSVGTSANFPNQAAYVTGPFRVQYNIPFTNAQANHPVGTVAGGPSWLGFFNVTNTAPVTIEVNKNGTIAAPTSTDGSVISLVPGHEWVTSIVSGAASLTSFNVGLWSVDAAFGRVIASYTTAAGNWSAFGSGSNFTSSGPPLFNILSQNLPPISGSAFPERIAIGNTGPLNITEVTMAQNTVPQVPFGTPPGTNNVNLARLIVSSIGSIGSAQLTSILFDYIGTVPAVNISNVSLWTGTFTAPVTQIGTTTINGLNQIIFSSLTTNIPSGVTYLWVRFDVGAGASLGNTVDISLAPSNITFGNFTGGATAGSPLPAVAQNPAGSVLIDYCTPTYNNGCGSGDAITNVTLNGSTVNLNNTTGCAASPYYSFFSSPNPDLQIGSTYTVNVTMGTDVNQYSRVWIDFNKNGVFETTESFSTGTNPGSNGTSAISVAIPAGASLGLTRMRIRGGDDAAILNTQACGASSSVWGETEDYVVEISSPTPFSVTSVTATQQTGGIPASSLNNNLLRVEINTSGSAGSITLTQARFTYSGTSATDIAASGVTLWNGTAGSPTTQLGAAVSLSGGLATFTGLSLALNAGTNYLWLRVNAAAGAVINNLVDASIAAGDFSFNAILPATVPASLPAALVDPSNQRFIDYCTPTYASGGGTDNITNVSLIGTSVNLNNNTAAAGNPNPYYTLYPTPNPDLRLGSSYTVNVTMGTDPNQYSRVWIDFNKNGVFETTESFANTSATFPNGTNAGSNGTSVISVNVPITATLGLTRMRVRGGNDAAILNTQACGASSSVWGETEDYVVDLVPPPDCSTLLPFPATVATASSTSVCSGDNVNFGITVPMPQGLGITYQWRLNGVNFGVVQNTPTASFALTQSGNYDVVVRCNGTPQVTSGAVAITVSTPAITGSTGASRCGFGSVTLNATASVGSTVEWYATPTSTTVLGTGNSFATPVISTSTNYYASASSVRGLSAAGALNPTIGTVANSLADFDYMQFNASQDLRIASFNVYPYQAGDLNFQLKNSAGTVLQSFNRTITAAEANSVFLGLGNPSNVIGTPVTIPVNWNVPAGNDYQIYLAQSTAEILVNTGGGNAFYGPSYQGVTFTSNADATQNSWLCFYNIQVETRCFSTPRTLVAATVTPAPAVNVSPSTSVNICQGESANLVASSTNLTYTYTWSPGSFTGASYSVSPLTTTSYVVNGVTSTGCTNQRSVTVIVNERPAAPTSVVTTPAVAPGDPVPFCPNPNGSFTAVQIGASATPISSTIFFDNFSNGFGAAPWNTAYTQVNPSEVHGLASRWNVISVPPTFIEPYGTVMNSTGSFAMAISDAQTSLSSGATAELISPQINIVPVATSSVTLKYRCAYRAWGGDVPKVQYSTDGGISWTDIPGSILLDNANVPSTLGDFSTQTLTIPAAAYAGGSFRLKFSYTSDWGYWWAVDDVEVTQQASSAEFTWSPAGGLYNDAAATTPYTVGTPVSTIYSAPFNDRTYQVTTRNPFTGCTSLPANITVDVCQAVIDQICNAQTLTVRNTPPADVNTLTNYSNLGAPLTGSLAGLCQPLKNDVWFKVVIPPSGDIHVYSFSAGAGTFDLDSTVVALYSSSDGTCTGVLTQLGCDAYNASNGHTYASASGLTPGSIAFIRVGSRQANSLPEAGRFKVLVMSGLYWTGAANNQVFSDPLNWYGSFGAANPAAFAPSASKSVIIPQSSNGSNYPSISGTSAVHGVNFINTLTPSSGANYRINIDPLGKLQINSSNGRGGFVMCTPAAPVGTTPNPRISGTGIIEFMATSPTPANNQHFIQVNSGFGATGTQIELAGATGIKANASLTTNNRLTFPNNAVLLSGGVASTTPSLNYSGNVVGNIRYIRTGSSYGNYDYWSAPITNASTSVLGSNFGTNLYNYDNQRPGASTNVQAGWGTQLGVVPMELGRGYIQTYAGNGTVTFTGTPTAVDFDFPVTRNGSNTFNLIGNPYPSSLSTSLFRSRNSTLLGTLYFWNQNSNPFTAANYVVVNSSNIVAGGTPPGDFDGSQIGACQGFLVSLIGSGTDIQFRNNDRVPSYPSTNTQWFESPASISLLRMQISSASGIEHNTVVAFSENASESFYDGEDSPRMPGASGVEVFSLNGSQELNIQMFPLLNAERIVELGVETQQTGNYTLNMTEFIEFDPSVRVFLEDRALNVFQNLNQNPQYVFNPADEINGVRFRLHFMTSIGFATSSTCLGSANGKIIVNNANPNFPVDLLLKNVFNENVASAQAVIGEHIFQNLPSGSYTLRVGYGSGDFEEMAVAVNTVGILNPASFVASATEVDLADAIIEFNAGDDESVVYTWDFGDGSPVITGTSTPVHAYMTPGIFTVTLTISNGGCSSSFSREVVVSVNATGINGRADDGDGIIIFPNPTSTHASIILNLGNSGVLNDVVIRVVDAAGRAVYVQELRNVKSGTIIPINTEKYSNGVYQVIFESQAFRQVKKLTVSK